MKKNVMMRIASVLMICVLISTCGISGTFAKYVTKAEATDSARVAYWGFEEPTSVDFKLFEHNDANVIGLVDETDIIAPGTKGEATLQLAFKENGNIKAPEVAYEYAFAISATGSYDALDKNENFVWKLNGVEYQKFADLQAEVMNLKETVEEGKLPTTQQITIGWEWKFVETDDANEADTAMGNAPSLDNITVTLTITATQVN